MSGTIKKRFLTFGTFILLLLTTFQIVLGENINNNQHEIIKTDINETFNNCIILIL